MTTIQVTDAEATILRAALASYLNTIRDEARLHRGGYSSRAIELNVLRLNIETVIATIDRPPVVSSDGTVIPIDAWRDKKPLAA